jgi:SSS family solute:Na+ symporter
MTLSLLDYLMIGLYGLAVGTVGFILVRKAKSVEGYFLAGRSLTWPFIGASLFAANISAEHFVGLAGAGYASGMAVGGFEWMAVYCLVPLIVLFLPFYIRNKIFTVPEFLEQRFSKSVRLFFSGFMVVLSVLTKISISLWAAALVFEELFGWPKLTVIWTVGLFTALYTLKGGLRVVVYTDALQSTVLVVGAMILTLIGLAHVGGWEALRVKLGPEMFHMVKPLADPDYPWFGMFVGVFLLGSFYWSMDQVLVQRVFAAKDLNEGRLGAILCGFLKMTTPFLLVLPGLIARALYPKLAKADLAYPTLLRELMPHGFLGLTVAGVVAALMGHISATYNSVATLVTRDFYLCWFPEATPERQVLVGRTVVVLVFVLGALWAPLIGKFGNLWIYLQTVQAYLMMPFAGIFFAGVLWKRATARGVLACLATAAVVCPLFMTNGLTHFLPFMDHPFLRPWLHAAFVAFVICMAVLVTVSLATAATPAAKLQTTTVSGWGDLQVSERVPWHRNYASWLGLLLVICSLLWFLMR